jgi:hypothetical protein
MATSEVRAKTVLSRRALLRASALAAGGGVLGVPLVRADDSAAATDQLPGLIALSTVLVRALALRTADAIEKELGGLASVPHRQA